MLRCFAAFGVVLATLACPAAFAEEGDTIEGAIWSFEMTPVAKRGEKRVGRFRVADHVLYQKDKPGPDSDDHVVGKNHPDGGKTMIEFDGLRTFPPGVRKPIGRISGKARLTANKFGDWEGQLVDADGFRWTFKCLRIRE